MRELTAADISACAGILCSVYNNALWQCRWEEQTAENYLMDLFRCPRFLGFVLEEQGSVIGALFAREKIWWNNTEVFVEEMFVAPEHQRKGCGARLLSRVEEYVRQRGLAGITLSTNRYAPARDFYQKNGFSACDHVLFMCKEMP